MAGDDSWLVLFERPPRSTPAGPGPLPEAAASTTSPAGDAVAERRICDVLIAWRAADRELASLTEADPEWSRVQAEIAGLRALHHRLFDLRAGQRTHERETASVRFAELARAWRMDTAPLPATA